MHATRKLWTWLAVICVLSFSVLGWVGREIYVTAPPIPLSVTDSRAEVIYSGPQIQHGQQAWLAAGGQQLGSVWGHGSYLAPDWSADWLHREALVIQDGLARREFGRPYADLDAPRRGHIDALVREELRINTYDAETRTLRLSDLRAAAVRQVAQHYAGLFGSDSRFDGLREQYAMKTGSLPQASDRAALSAFFFWSSWSAATDRPGESGLSYTSNWPHEPLPEMRPPRAPASGRSPA